MRVIHGTSPRPRSALQAAYDEFRLDRQGELVSPRTLEYYDDRIGQFLDWLAQERPGVRRVGDLDVGTMRESRAFLSWPCNALGAAASAEDDRGVAHGADGVPEVGASGGVRRAAPASWS